jgi:hypothetical protein
MVSVVPVKPRSARTSGALAPFFTFDDTNTE